jgi:hypothetical protein
MTMCKAGVKTRVSLSHANALGYGERWFLHLLHV